MKRGSNRFWKEVLGDAALVRKGTCIVNLYYTYLLTLIPKRLIICIETYNSTYGMHYSIKAVTRDYHNMRFDIGLNVENLRRYLNRGLLNSHDPKELIKSVEEYYSDHSTPQYKISTKLITTVLSELDFLYSEFCQGEFRFWLRGIKVVIDIEHQCNVIVKQIVSDTILATYAGNSYGLKNLKSRYFN